MFKTVEIPKTDSNGEALAHLQLNDVKYTLIIIKNGEILATFTDVAVYCPNAALTDCEINLNSFESHLDPKDYTTLDDFSFTLTMDKATREVESVFSIPSGSVATMLLNVTLFDNLGNFSVCADSLTSSSGTLSCVVPVSAGNGSVLAQVSRDGVLEAQTMFSLGESPFSRYGNNLVFLGLFLMLTLVGVGIVDEPIITGFFIFIGAVLNIFLNLTTTSAWFGGGATILWLGIVIIILLIKRTKRM